MSYCRSGTDVAASRQLPLVALPEPARQPATGTVRLLIFNAQHKSPSRARRQAAWIASQRPVLAPRWRRRRGAGTMRFLVTAHAPSVTSL